MSGILPDPKELLDRASQNAEKVADEVIDHGGKDAPAVFEALLDAACKFELVAGYQDGRVALEIRRKP